MASPAADGGSITGSALVAQTLAACGVKYMFGVIGIPVTAVATEAQKAGIRYIGFRNEQAAGYAASIVGYLTGFPAVLLTVSAPGMIHGLAGCGNALANCWPMVMISGSVETEDVGKGGFQEIDQCRVAGALVKSAARAARPEDMGRIVADAVSTAVAGCPGATYIDLPADILFKSLPRAVLGSVPQIPIDPFACSVAPSREDVQKAASLLARAKRPLLVFGRGAAYGRAEEPLRALVDTFDLPFLPSPMGKGVVPDSHPRNVSAARSMAIGQADVALVVGTRLNWQLHFGEAPRWRADCQFIQVNLDEEELGKRRLACALRGDARAVTKDLHAALSGMARENTTEWVKVLADKAAGATAKLTQKLSAQLPAGKALDFHAAYGVIKACVERLRPEPVVVSEGANTMDIGRSVMQHQGPRLKLDAGAWGTMGVGLGYSVAAAVADPSRWTVALEGDSAFGFSGMECEVMCRYSLPIVAIVFNNSGVYGGDRRPDGRQGQGAFAADPAPTDFVSEARYDRLMEAFGGRGFLVRSQGELRRVLDEVFAGPKGPVLVNLIIDPMAGVESGNMKSHNVARPPEPAASKL